MSLQKTPDIQKTLNFIIAAPPGGTSGTVCHSETFNLTCNSSEVVVAKINVGGLRFPNRGPTQNCTYDKTVPSKHCLGYRDSGDLSKVHVRDCVWRQSSCRFGPLTDSLFNCAGSLRWVNFIHYSQFQCFNSKYVSFF